MVDPDLNWTCRAIEEDLENFNAEVKRFCGTVMRKKTEKEHEYLKMRLKGAKVCWKRIKKNLKFVEGHYTI